MTVNCPPVVRTLLLAGGLAALSTGCASIQKAVDSVRGEPAAAPAEAPPRAEAQETTPPSAPSRPVVRSKSRVVEPPVPAPAPTPAAEVKPAPVVRAPAKAPEIPGPAWLRKCLKVQVAGGVVRCDADLLLAKPSATVQVFTRDPARVVEGLPHVYRLYVVP
jgi:hypothetical protein